MNISKPEMEDLNHIRCVFKSIEEEKNKAVCKNQKLCQMLYDMRDELCEMKRVNDDLTNDLDSSERKVKTLQNENCKLSSCISDKNEEIRHLQKVFQEVDKLKCYVTRLEQDKACYEKTMKRAEETNQELQRCLQEKDFVTRRLECKVGDLQEEIRGMENALCRLQHENEQRTRELVECQDALNKGDIELVTMSQKLKCTEQTKQKLQDCVKQLQKNLYHTENVLDQEKMANKKLTEKICDCQKECQRLKAENMCLVEQNDEMDCKIQHCCKIVAKKQQELDNVTSDFANYRHNIEELKGQIGQKSCGKRRKSSLPHHKFSCCKEPSSAAKRAPRSFSKGRRIGVSKFADQGRSISDTMLPDKRRRSRCRRYSSAGRR